MKFNVLVAAALASLAIAAPAPEAEVTVPELVARGADLEARQTPTSNLNQPCGTPYKPGDYVCHYDSVHKKSWIAACQITNRWVFIAWCPGTCYNYPGYPVCV